MENAEIIDLEKRMDQIESKLDASLIVMSRIEQGIFGDEKLRIPGLLQTHADLQTQIDQLKIEIADLKKVNESQDTAIKAKRGLTDDVVKWLTRAFWSIAVVAALVLLITGKIGLVELFNLK